MSNVANQQKKYLQHNKSRAAHIQNSRLIIIVLNRVKIMHYIL